jgi:uncharacterized protein
MTQPAKGQEPSMEDILASIRRIISDEPARIPAAEPRVEALRNNRRIADSGRDDVREHQLRAELRTRLLWPESPTRIDERHPEEPPVKPAEEKSAQASPSMQSSASASILDGIHSALEAELQHSEIDVLLAKLHGGAAPLHEPTPDILEKSSPVPIRPPQFAEEGKRSEQIYGDRSEDLVNQAELSAVEQEEEEPEPIGHLSHLEEPQRAIHSSPEARHFSPPRHSEERALLSDATSAAVDSAFNALAETVLVQNGRTLEDLVREMLRPMLKSWLDDNLPNLVERLVRAEIERVSRGR